MNSPAILGSSRSSKSATDLAVEVQQSQLIGALESAMDKVQAENLLRLVADMVESQGGDPVKIVSPVKQSSGQAQEVPGPRKTPGVRKIRVRGAPRQSLRYLDLRIKKQGVQSRVLGTPARQMAKANSRPMSAQPLLKNGRGRNKRDLHLLKKQGATANRAKGV